jgi:hypothetical protein
VLLRPAKAVAEKAKTISSPTNSLFVKTKKLCHRQPVISVLTLARPYTASTVI